MFHFIYGHSHPWCFLYVLQSCYDFSLNNEVDTNSKFYALLDYEFLKKKEKILIDIYALLDYEFLKKKENY